MWSGFVTRDVGEIRVSAFREKATPQLERKRKVNLGNTHTTNNDDDDDDDDDAKEINYQSVWERESEWERA